VVVSAVRALDGRLDTARGAAELAREVGRLGQPLYEAQPPTGYPDRAESWVNTGALLGRMNFALSLAHNRFRAASVDLDAVLGSADRSQPAHVLDRLLTGVLHGAATPQTRAVLTAQLESPEITRTTGDDRVASDTTWRSWRRSSSVRPSFRGDEDGRHAAIVPEGRRPRPRRDGAPCPASWCGRRWRSRVPRARRCSWSSSSAAPSDGLSMLRAARRRRLLRRARQHRIARPSAQESAVDLDGFFGLHPAPGARSSRCGTNAAWRRCTPAARRIPRARTSTPRTTWSRARPA
jgi:hypothetical protein